MSSVKSVTIHKERPWKNGYVKRFYSVTLTDNDLIDHVFIVGPIKVSATDDGQNAADALLASKRQAEKEAAKTGDPLTKAQNGQWAVQKKMFGFLCRWFMREKDPYTAVYLKPIFDWLDVNKPTGPQQRNYLDFTADQNQKFNRRRRSMLEDTGTGETLLTAYEVEEEDIPEV